MRDGDVDAWLDRIEPRVIAEWMAFETLEPWGWPVLGAILDWLRKALALILSSTSGSQLDEDQMPRINVAFDADPQDQWQEPLTAADADFGDAAGESTSEDILRDLREQNLFR